MSTFDSTTYNVSDFLEWYERKQLILSPKFQRRNVWKDVAKSFLIDSILRDKPLPKIFVRQITDIKTRTTIREVVDGQQRLRTIIDFINDGFKVRKVHNEIYGEKYFSQLDDDAQRQILTYKFSVDTLIGVEDSEIMDIFARLNTYSTPLNKQELINAEFYGYFKQLTYKVSHKYNKFWIESKIFTEYQTMRMYEVEITADIFIAFLDGIQGRKQIKNYYKRYDEELPNKESLEAKFDEIVSVIVKMYNDNFKNTPYKKPALFYSLFLAIYNLKYTLPGFEDMSRIETFDDRIIAKTFTVLDKIQDIIETAESEDNLSREQNAFIISISRATTDPDSRLTRTKFIIDELNRALFA